MAPPNDCRRPELSVPLMLQVGGDAGRAPCRFAVWRGRRMDGRRCASCGEVFRPCAQVPQQKFCGAEECQRARRRRWQQSKRQSDADYRENQALAWQKWAQSHRDYWREYRRAHPQYCETNRNRTRQRQRARRRQASTAVFAKMDASPPFSTVRSGTYLLVPAATAEFAKMDVWMVEITLISKT